MFKLLVLLFIPALLFGNQTLADRFTFAKPGQYVVTEQNGTLSLLLIRDKVGKKLTLEEVTAPKIKLDPKSTNWQHWLNEKAPGCSSWIGYQIDLESGQLTESYSYLRGSFLYIDEKEHFFAKLLKLPLKEVPTDEKRKIGPQPNAEEPDFRADWSPPKLKKEQHFLSKKASWPKDGSALSQSSIELYFDADSDSSPFPYWTEISSSHYHLNLRAIAVGSQLHSPQPPLPHR